MDTIQKLLAVLPSSWFSDDAKAEGGTLYALLSALAEGLNYVDAGADYVQDQTRISTATGTNLDNIGNDFFSDRITRKAGENDDAWRARILREIFRDKATRAAIIQAVEDLGCTVVEYFEPFKDGFFTDYSHMDATRISDLDPYKAVIYVKRSLAPDVFPFLFTDGGHTDYNYVPGESSNIWTISDDEVLRVVNETRAAGITIFVVFDPIPVTETSGSNRTSDTRYYIERHYWSEDAEGAHADEGDLVDDGELAY
jgi:hypothetical protein